MKEFVRLFRDGLSSYGAWSTVGDKVYEDEKGKYKLKTITKEVPCHCHPETCCHFDGKYTKSSKEKVYIKDEKETLKAEEKFEMRPSGFYMVRTKEKGWLKVFYDNDNGWNIGWGIMILEVLENENQNSEPTSNQEQGNFIIAKYMGYTYPNVKNTVWKYDKNSLHCYHENWKELMSVVEKISLYFNQCSSEEINCIPSEAKQIWELKMCAPSILTVWESVVEFITWYNRRNNQN